MLNNIKAAGFIPSVREETGTGTMTVYLDIPEQVGKCRRGHILSEAGNTKAGGCGECARQDSMFHQYGTERDEPRDPDTFTWRLGEYGLLKNRNGEKHIPSGYLVGSIKQRLALLQGLMDTDGSIQKNGQAEFGSSSERLALDVFELIAGLGFKPAISYRDPKIKYKGMMVDCARAYRIQFRAYSDTPVFRLKRKLARQPKRDRPDRAFKTDHRMISYICPVESVPVRCIQVDSPNHLYLAGRAMIPTHNTELPLNIIGYHIHHDPAPILLVQPTLEMAEAFSKDRLAPMIRDTPALHGKVKDARARDSGNTLLHKVFPGGHITMAGANSAASLASRPIRVVLCDEVDRYPFSAGTEGDPVKLAQKRSTTFYNRKTVLVSTPTIEGASRIDQAYQESDQRLYHVPCPLCEVPQPLIFEQIKWEKDEKGAPANVRYACAHCHGEFDDSKKDWMLLNGKWIAQAPFKGIAGFHLSELYSPWRKWEDTVAEFLEAKKSNETLKVWVNTALGETWKEKGDAPEWKRLYERREQYPKNRLPTQVLFVTAGVDVQSNRLEVEIVGWGRDKQSWSIDYRTISGDTATPEPWKELDNLLMEEWPHERGTSLPIRMMAVDSGFNTQHVYNWARRHPVTRVMAVKGVDRASVLLGQPSAVDVSIKGVRIRRGFQVWTVCVGMAKSELYSWLRLEKPIGDEPYPPGYCHLPEYATEYFEQLTAETQVARVFKGFKRYEWVKTRERNEALDVRIYSRAAASRVGLDRLSPAKWDELASEIGLIAKPAAPKPATDKKPPRPSFWKK